jgi:trimethylamine--corrinoid protein Co-methyltransferase
MQPVLTLFGTEDIRQIHIASVDLLETVGVKIDDPEFRDQMCEAGCSVVDGRVRIPGSLVEKALAAKRKPAFVYNRGHEAIDLLSETLTHPFGDVANLYDLDTFGLRPATLDDLACSIRLTDALECIDLAGPMLMPDNIPPELLELKMIEYSLRYTRKPCFGCVSSGASARFIIAMLEAMAGDKKALKERPIGTLSVCPENPLDYPVAVTDAIRTIIPAGVPTNMMVCPTCGLTAPMSVSGGLMQQNANMLAFTVMAFLIAPETPLIYAARLDFPNMRSATILAGLPEMGMAGACAVQLAHSYGFPSDVYGLSTSSHAFDEQCGYEKALNGILPVLAGTNILSGPGSLSNSTVASLEQLVIDNEIVRELRRIKRGFLVDQDSLASDLVKTVVLGGGDFVATSHTVKYLRSDEVFEMKAGYSKTLSQWQDEGEPAIRERANVTVKAILKEHQVPPLCDDLEKEIVAIYQAAERELCSQ